jgi:hypothetical protein
VKSAERDGDVRRGAMAAAASDRLIASTYLTRAEDLLAGQTRRTIEENRPQVARKLDISISACDFIRRQRRKIVPFLEAKIKLASQDGFHVELSDINPALKPHVRVAVRGRSPAAAAPSSRASACRRRRGTWR